MKGGTGYPFDGRANPVELIVIAEIFEQLPVGDFRVRCNNRKIPQGFYLGIGLTDIVTTLRIVDKLDKVGAAGVRAMLVEAGATAQQAEQCLALAEISTASSEQSSGVSQVDEAVRQMDSATQQNAALVEQSAAAAESLKQQAAHLVSTVSAFKLGSDARV